MIPFGKWRPDVFDLDTGVAGDADGVLPGANSKHPWPSLEAITGALPDEPRGAYFARKIDGSVAVYAGTATGLYLYGGSDVGWQDVSQGTYSLPEGDRWSFAQFGSKLIAVNISDNPQDLNIETGADAVDLAGSPPKARRCATIGDHLWLLSTQDNAQRVLWSGINDCEWWTLGKRDCDFQDFPDGGDVTGVTSLEAGLLFQESAVRHFNVVQDTRIYTFNFIDDTRGLIAPDSLVTKGGVAYYLSEEGFIAMSAAGESRSIGFEQVDAWLKDRVDTNNLYSVTGCVDPLRARIFWMFPVGAGSVTLMNECLCYDIQLDEWTHATFDAYQLMPGASFGTTLEGVDSLGFDLDTLPFSLDSRKLKGGVPLLAGFDGDKKLGFTTGANLAARMETAEFQPVPLRRAFVRGIQPITDAITATAEVGSRDNLQYSRKWGPRSTINQQGWCPTRASVRYARVRVSIPAGVTWSDAAGVEIDAVQDGQR